MIDYSVYLLGNPVHPDQPEKAYARAQVREVYSLDKFARHIANHNGVYSRGTVKGVISDMCQCLVEMLLSGNKIQLGELGSFWLSLSSEGAVDCLSFSAENITAVNILFTPGEEFHNLVDRATFNLVSSRSAQAATLKAERNGETTVDLSTTKAPNTPTDPDDAPDTPDDGGNGSTSGGSGNGSDGGLE